MHCNLYSDIMANTNRNIITFNSKETHNYVTLFKYVFNVVSRSFSNVTQPSSPQADTKDTIKNHYSSVW